MCHVCYPSLSYYKCKKGLIRLSTVVIHMREHILTPRERKVVETFLKNHITNNDIYILKFRIKAAQPRLKEDMRLIEELVKEAP